MALRRIESVTNTTTGKSATVYRNAELNEYQVKFSQDGKFLPAADYFTDDKGDAQRTARTVWRDLKATPALRMRLVYTDNPTREVKIGDEIKAVRGGLGEVFIVESFSKPHKPSSSGKVSVIVDGHCGSCEYFVSVLGAEWVDRDDQQ